MLCVTVASVLYVGFQLVKTVVFEMVDEMRNHINHAVPGGCISRQAQTAWPPQSLDLTSLDFFFFMA